MDEKLVNKLIKLQDSQKDTPPSVQGLVIEIIAPPKFGKTTFFTSNEESILLAFETGYKFRSKCAKISIDEWKGKKKIYTDADGVTHMSFIQAMDFLASTRKYKFVIVDTVDMMAKMCSDYFCELKGVEHPSEGGEYGKGWDLCLNAPMRKAILQLSHMGRGLGLITHSKTEIARFSSGERARKESTLGGKVRILVESQADIILHGEFGRIRKPNNKRDRIIVTEGDNDTLAGNRSNGNLPARFILDPERPWAQFESFFSDPAACEAADLRYKKLYKK